LIALNAGGLRAPHDELATPEILMRAPLTDGGLLALRDELERRRQELTQRLREHQSGQSRTEHMIEVREQDADDVPQREGERELDMAISDLETRELGRVVDALRRMDAGRYGLCADCEEEIPIERLRAEPWALRCVACQARREG
jgi:RNA polymerase-binding protein DksA